MAGIFRGGVDDTLREEGERLAGLERGAGRILPHDGTVEQRPHGVLCE